jgi:hypothetical protein
MEVLKRNLARAAAAANGERATISRAPAERADIDLPLVVLISGFAIDSINLEEKICNSHCRSPVRLSEIT